MIQRVEKEIEYNIAQLFFIVRQALFTVLEWARGVGKSTIIGKRIVDCVEQMPRSTGVLVGSTFAQIKTRTLPSTIAGLEMHGFYKDVHYIVGKKPPESWGWPEPYEPPLDYKNCIIFYNGTVLVFVSQDGSASSGRGINSDWVIGDEAAILDEEKFMTDVLATNRGNMYRKAEYQNGTWDYYSNCSLHHSVLLASSTPVTAKGQWILKYEEKAVLEPARYCFLKSSAEANRKNLGDDYFITNKASMKPYIYSAEIENKRLQRIESSFYPKLDEDKHTYNKFNAEYYADLSTKTEQSCLGDDDLNLDLPLIITVDWGGNINCLVVAQQLPGELRVLKNFFVTSPDIIDDLIKNEFAPYYEKHRNRQLFFIYDPSGNAKVANSRLTYAQQLSKILATKNWNVTRMSRFSYNVGHDRKYQLCNNLFSELDPALPKIRINRTNCNELFISMSNAPTKRGPNGEIKKDKGSERSKKTPQQYATHMSDVFDLIVSNLYMHLTVQSSSVPTTTIR